MINAGRKNLIYKLMMLVSILLVSVWRHPELFYQPRFFAEEGTVFFSYAFNHSFLENLLHPQFGYYTLYNFIATSFAAVFPVEIAPLVTTYLALGLQLAASCAVLWADIPELNSNVKRFAVAVSIALLPYRVIWLNTLGAQYMLCVITFVLLLENPVARQRIGLAVRSVILVMAGLTGVVSCFMLPSFIYKAVRTKSKPFAVYSIILSICSLFQCGIFLQARLSNDAGLAARFVQHDSAMLLRIFTKFMEFQFFVPFFGRSIREMSFIDKLEMGIRSIVPAWENFDRPLSTLFIGGGVLIVCLLIVYYAKNSINAQITLFSIVTVALLSTIFSINMTGGPRYTFAPSVMIIILLVSDWQEKRAHRLLRYVAVLLVSSMVLVNGMESRFASFGFDFEHWPKWGDEISMWKQNKSYPIKIWPPPWEMKLQK